MEHLSALSLRVRTALDSLAQVSQWRYWFTRVHRAQTIAAIATALVVVAVVTATLNDTRHARSMWTGEVRALSVRHDVPRGKVLTADDIVEVLLPPALVPESALSDLRDGMQAAIDLPSRSIITGPMINDRIAVPESWRVVAFSATAATLPLSPGDAVDIVVGTTVLVESAVVVSVTPLTLAVPAERAPDVAAAVRLGDVSLVGR